jgi:hypothetical protein
MRTHSLLSLALVAGLTACGGGNSTGNSRPTLSGLADGSIPQDSVSVPFNFTVNDVETPAADLVVRVTTSDPELLPPFGLELRGTGSSRTLAVTPAEAANGSAMVTVTVRDAGGAETTRNIRLRVAGTSINFSTLTEDAFALTEEDDPRMIRGLDIAPDVDDSDAAFNALIQ